jgi:pimeloyl-ACP methyl ester carboxylesterase
MKIPAILQTTTDQLYEYRDDYLFTPGGTKRSRFYSAIIPCMLGFGCAYQAMAEVRDRRTFRPPGKMVELDGCRIHLNATSPGKPAVILESGLGGMSSAWGWVQQEAAKFGHIVSYDRAGLGWSEEDTSPKTAVLVAKRLRSLLLKAEISPPYVLVGHSMGGLFTRVFADLYPEEVTGMVLIDAAHPDQNLRSTAIDIHMRSGFRLLRAVPLLVGLGYVRLTGLFNSWPDGLPAKQAAEASAFLSSYRHLKTTRDESMAWETICTEVRSTRGLGDMPLAVVTACKDILPGHPELQHDLMTLSTSSTHFAIKGADHLSVVTHRSHALSVVDAIHHVVKLADRRQLGVGTHRATRNSWLP